jgi:antitoxin (DNA-binding transcriptional repressor) of toxin-antitoxin stability system
MNRAEDKAHHSERVIRAEAGKSIQISRCSKPVVQLPPSQQDAKADTPGRTEGSNRHNGRVLGRQSPVVNPR